MSRQRKLLIVFAILIAISALIIVLRRDSRDIVTTGYFWGMLIYLPPVLAVIFLVGWNRRRKRMKRIEAGLCEACGYDVRGSADRCPECGTAIRKSVPKVSS